MVISHIDRGDLVTLHGERRVSVYEEAPSFRLDPHTTPTPYHDGIRDEHSHEH